MVKGQIEVDVISQEKSTVQECAEGEVVEDRSRPIEKRVD